MKLWIYGKVMSGKTTFASQFENAYIISTDGNAEYTFAPDKILRVRNYKELNDAIAKLKTIKPEWVIVDTTSYLIDYLRFYWCDKNGVEVTKTVLNTNQKLLTKVTQCLEVSYGKVYSLLQMLLIM